MNDNVDDPWAEYARLSKISDSDTVNDRTWGADEALDELLSRIEAEQPVTTSELTNLVNNRARKHRIRRIILAKNTILIPRIAANEDERQHALHLLRRSATTLTTLESRLLFAVAEGKTYGELARRAAVPVGTMKTWVRRARLKIVH